MKQIISIGLLFCSVNAWAQLGAFGWGSLNQGLDPAFAITETRKGLDPLLNREGHGGYAFVCYSDIEETKIRWVRLVDLYFADRNRDDFEVKLSREKGASFEEKVDYALMLLSWKLSNKASGYQRRFKEFMAMDPWSDEWESTEENDTNLFDIPKKDHSECAVIKSERIANQLVNPSADEKKFHVRSDLFDLLGLGYPRDTPEEARERQTNEQAALILHELFYEEAIIYGAQTSEKVRKLIQVIVDKSFEKLPPIELLDRIRQAGLPPYDIFHPGIPLHLNSVRVGVLTHWAAIITAKVRHTSPSMNVYLAKRVIPVKKDQAYIEFWPEGKIRYIDIEPMLLSTELSRIPVKAVERLWFDKDENKGTVLSGFKTNRLETNRGTFRSAPYEFDFAFMDSKWMTHGGETKVKPFTVRLEDEKHNLRSEYDNIIEYQLHSVQGSYNLRLCEEATIDRDGLISGELLGWNLLPKSLIENFGPEFYVKDKENAYLIGPRTTLERSAERFGLTGRSSNKGDPEEENPFFGVTFVHFMIDELSNLLKLTGSDSKITIKGVVKNGDQSDEVIESIIESPSFDPSQGVLFRYYDFDKLIKRDPISGQVPGDIVLEFYQNGEKVLEGTFSIDSLSKMASRYAGGREELFNVSAPFTIRRNTGNKKLVEGRVSF